MHSLAELEQWMEEQLPRNLHDLPGKVSTTIQSYYTHLYSQISDITPTYQQIESSIESSFHSIPFVGHSIAPEPIPPPPPISLFEALMRRADVVTGSRNRTSVIGGISLVGITFAVLTRSMWLPRKRGSRLRLPRIKNGVRQEAIIILGADTPLGQLLSHHLSAQGFIVLASVANEQSMQAFDSLVPPSSRGYIKTILHDPSNPNKGTIETFVTSIMSAKELRWPLTSAGDPYSRPGVEVQITGIVNAMSYHATSEELPSFHVDTIAGDLNQRVITPLATIEALLPSLANASPSGSRFVISLVPSKIDISTQALKVGMQKLNSDVQEIYQSSKISDRILLTTLEATPSSMKTILQSLLPTRFGGIAPRITSLNASSSAPGTRSLSDSLKGSTAERGNKGRDLTSSGSNSSMTSSSSSLNDRSQRLAEYKAIAEAVTNIMLLPCNTTSLRSRYVVRLPASVNSRMISGTQDGNGLERTLLLRTMQVCSTPLILLRSILVNVASQAQIWASCWTRASRNYYGSRNAINSRPAYGPGPGPASNTHSRSCIKPNNTTARESTRSLRRTRSATSVSSNEASYQAGSRQAASGPSSISTPSRPSSNNDMSSSGLLSSVPSSAFGDASEEEHFDDEGSTNSPVHDTDSWASPFPSNPDHDSDTALGARTAYSANNNTDETPSASRSVESQEQYGFPSHASMQSNHNDVWMGPASRGSPALHQDMADRSDDSTETASSTATIGSQTPLGQSWVALGQSSMRESE